MIVTEEEAKTKRCPESFPAHANISTDGTTMSAPVFSHHQNGMGINGMGITVAIQTAPSHCIGSACMAWRWKLEGEHMMAAPIYAGFNQGPSHAVPVPGSGQPSTTHGYCGKAGRP